MLFRPDLIFEKVGNLLSNGITEYAEIVKSLIKDYGIPATHIVQIKHQLKSYLDSPISFKEPTAVSKYAPSFQICLYCFHFSMVSKHIVTYGKTICDKNRLWPQLFCKSRRIFIDSWWVDYTNSKLDAGIPVETSWADRLRNLNEVPKKSKTVVVKWYGIDVLKEIKIPTCKYKKIDKEPGISQRTNFLNSLRTGNYQIIPVTGPDYIDED